MANRGLHSMRQIADLSFRQAVTWVVVMVLLADTAFFGLIFLIAGGHPVFEGMAVPLLVADVGGTAAFLRSWRSERRRARQIRALHTFR